MMYTYFMNVWDPFVEAYLSMGWMFTDNPLISEDRGGHAAWLMVWPCDCKPHYLKKRNID